MRFEGAELPAPRYIEVTPDVRQFLVRYYRLRNLLIDVMADESVPQVVRDRVMVCIGARPQKIELSELEKITKLSVADMS